MKIVYGVKYVHKGNLLELNDNEIKLVNDCRNILKEKNIYGYNNYVIIKVDMKNQCVSFIESKDFDIVHEPTVGDAHKININGEYKLIKEKKNPQIYHHKHTFVSDDYKGFDIEESKLRSLEWEMKMNEKIDKRKIGYKNYWLQCLKIVSMNT